MKGKEIYLFLYHFGKIYQCYLFYIMVGQVWVLERLIRAETEEKVVM